MHEKRIAVDWLNKKTLKAAVVAYRAQAQDPLVALRLSGRSTRGDGLSFTTELETEPGTNYGEMTFLDPRSEYQAVTLSTSIDWQKSGSFAVRAAINDEALS